MQDLRDETPEVRLVDDRKEFVAGLGPEASRLLAALPKFVPVFREGGAA